MPKPIDRMGLGPTRSVEEIDDNLYRVTVTPPAWSGYKKGKSIDLTLNQFERYKEWMLNNVDMIQDVFPELTAEQREILLNGT